MNGEPAASGFNEAQQRRLLAHAQHADKLISEIDEILRAAETKSPFPRYRPDVSLDQARLIRNQLSRFRDHLGRVLAAVGIKYEGARFGALHSIRVTLSFVRIAVQEMAPEYLKGYGELPDTAAAELRGLCAELEGLINSLERHLALGPAAGLASRLERLQQTTGEAELLRRLDEIITEEELGEFRPALLSVVERVESPRFEIAVFGRVSSGKSSLLNRVLETEVLPVGVNPITAVPTRLIHGPQARLTVTLADREVRERPIEDLAAYASEERNPGNTLGVTRLVVALPSPRLENGLVLVDTPGLGALATAGAAETLSYLPRCDLGLLLISSASPINEEDLNTIQALALAGIPVMGLLSKADLLSAADRRKAVEYSKKQVLANLGMEIDFDPVSTAGEASEMLEAWIGERLKPLLERHRELGQESTRRKAGALREGVLAALRMKLGDSREVAAAEGPRDYEELERRLREAAGDIESTRRICLAATDEARALDEVALRACAEAVLESWSQPPGQAPAPAEAVNRTLEQLATGAASKVIEPLARLAEDLQATLEKAAEALPGSTLAAEENFRDLVREIPRFEARVERIGLGRVWFAGWRGLARHWLAARLEKEIAPLVKDSFANYGRALETWTGRVLALLDGQFEARADAYRAQLARLIERRPLAATERARLAARVAELERAGHG